MCCNISEKQEIFCGHAKYKQYYEAKTSSIFPLVVVYGINSDGRGPVAVARRLV